MVKKNFLEGRGERMFIKVGRRGLAYVSAGLLEVLRPGQVVWYDVEADEMVLWSREEDEPGLKEALLKGLVKVFVNNSKWSSKSVKNELVGAGVWGTMEPVAGERVIRLGRMMQDAEENEGY